MRNEAPIAERVFESALVTAGYRILSREPFLPDDEAKHGTWYRVARTLEPDVEVGHWCILDSDADDEAEGWKAATAVVKVLAYQEAHPS